jgi:hypothetical protein
VLRWPLGGSELDSIDLVGVAEDGQVVIGAARQRLGVEAVGRILDGALALASALPTLFEGAGAPVQLAAPRLLVAAEEIDGAAECVLSRLALDTTCFVIERRYSDLLLREREITQSAPMIEESPATGEPLGAIDAVAAPGRPESEEAPDQAGQSDRGRSRATRGRRRGESRGGSRKAKEPAGEEPAAVGGPRFEEISLFDLDDDADEVSDSKAEGTGRRRGRGRGRGRGSGQARRADEDKTVPPLRRSPTRAALEVGAAGVVRRRRRVRPTTSSSSGTPMTPIPCCSSRPMLRISRRRWSPSTMTMTSRKSPSLSRIGFAWSARSDAWPVTQTARRWCRSRSSRDPSPRRFAERRADAR